MEPTKTEEALAKSFDAAFEIIKKAFEEEQDDKNRG